jgi:hypothetical protein
MTESSKKAFSATTQLRKKHRKLVFSVCWIGRTNREIATATGLKYNQVQKRSSELYLSGEFKIIGEKIEGGRANPIYIQSKATSKPDKKLTYPEYCKTREDWKHIYEAVVNHKL